MLDRVTDEDEENFQLDDSALPHLIRVIHSLAPKWHQFSLQLGVPDIDEIKKDGSCADDCLVLALQNWLRQENSCWKELITAIYQPAGGGHQLLARKVSKTFRQICTFQPIEMARNISTDNILCEDSDPEEVKVIVRSIQGELGNSVAYRWYQLGTVLGTPVGELEMIRHTANITHIEREAMMLEAWLNCAESNKTWQWFVDSIAHQAGGKHPKTARKIAVLHPGVSSDEATLKSASATPCPQASSSQQPVENPINKSKPPNMVDIMHFPTSRGYKNLVREIAGKDYKTVGTLLLNDESSAILGGLEKSYKHDANDITHEILKIWITEGKTAVTWDGFLTVLRNSGMNTLAGLVESGLTK